MSKYTDQEKEQSRVWLFSTTIDRLRDTATPAQNARALILVDGDQDRARDLEVLRELGVLSGNVWAVASKWNPEAKKAYEGAQTIEGELSEFLATPHCPEFHILYFDFCKPLPNESKEHHIAVIYNIFYYNRLSNNGILITNFSVSGYFDDVLYRNFLTTYVSPEFYQEGHWGMISVKALSSGWNMIGQPIFNPSQKPDRSDPKYHEQKIKILMCFMYGFIQDMATVYAPFSQVRHLVNMERLSELEEFIETRPPRDFRSESPEVQAIFKKRTLLDGRLAQCANLLEKCPPKIIQHLTKYTGTVEELRSIAVLTDLHSQNFPLRDVYRLRHLYGLPYPGTHFEMLPMIWQADKLERTGSWEIWGNKNRRG